MLTHDLRFAWRMLAGRPFFSLVAVLMLGLGIGANATIFSWVETVILRPIPGVDVSRLVALHGTTSARNDLSFSYPNFVDLRAMRPDGIDDLADGLVQYAVIVGLQANADVLSFHVPLPMSKSQGRSPKPEPVDHPKNKRPPCPPAYPAVGRPLENPGRQEANPCRRGAYITS